MANQLTEVGFNVQAAITENGRVEMDGSISVLLNNAGDSTITINGNLTILPGDTLQLSTPNTDTVINDYLTAHFTGGSGRLEVIAMYVKDPAHSNY